MEKIKTFLKRMFEPSRVVVALISGACLFYATGVGPYFVHSQTGVLLLDLVRSVSWLNFIGGGHGFTMFRILIEIIGWSGFIYCFREICMRFHPGDDRVKFTYSAIIMTAAIFIYTTTRILKNITAVPIMAGAGVSFLKIASSPFSFIAGLLIVVASIHVKPKNWVNVMIIPFVGYFVLYFVFAFGQKWLLPSDAFLDSIFLHNNIVAGDGVIQYISKYFCSFIDWVIPRVCLANWPTSIFYVLAEAFGTACVVSLPYQVLNVHMSKEQSKRWIPMTLLIGQFATIISGLIFQLPFDPLAEYDIAVINGIKVASDALKSIVLVDNAGFLGVIGTFVIGIAGAIMILSNFLLFKRHIVEEPEVHVHKGKTEKKRYGLIEIVKLLPLSAICLIFFNPIYGFGSSIIEQVWQINNKNTSTAIVKYFFPALSGDKLKGAAENIYQFIYSGYILLQGRLTIIAVVIVAYIMHFLSWFVVSITMPISIIVLSTVFLIPLAIFGKNGTIMGRPVLTFCTHIGSVCLLFIKSYKIAGTDFTKETAISTYDLKQKTMIKSGEAVTGKFGKILTAVLIMMVDDITAKPTAVLITLIVVAGLSLLWIVFIGIVDKDLKEKHKIEG